MNTKLILAGVVCAVALTTCSAAVRRSPEASTAAKETYASQMRSNLGRAERMAGAPATDAMFAAERVAGAPEGGAAPGGLAVLAASTPDRYLIKNATVLIETQDARAATDQLTAALAQVNGYVSDLNESVNAFGKRTVVMQVRVPAGKFDQSMMNVEALGKVLNKQVTTQDVTEQYVDTDARVRNLKSTEERLLEHLKRAGVLEDVLRVEKELTRVREQIEQLEGQLRFLSDRVAYSTIAITLQEAPKTEPVVPAETFSTGKVFSEAVRSLVAFGQALWVRVIWIGVWAPVWIVPLLVTYVVVRRLRRRAMAA